MAGGFGLFLFFIQRWKEKQDKEQNLIFRLYQLIERRIDISQPGGQSELDRKWTEIKSTSFLLKDTDLGRKIYKLTQERNQDGDDINIILKKIASKLNKKLIKEINANSSKQN